MSTKKKLRILGDIFGSYYRSGGEYLFSCPKCNHHKPKLSVNMEKGVFKCWVCEYSGTNIFRLVKAAGDYNQKKRWRELDGRVELNNFESQIKSLLKLTTIVFACKKIS